MERRESSTGKERSNVSLHATTMDERAVKVASLGGPLDWACDVEFGSVFMEYCVMTIYTDGVQRNLSA